MLWKRLFKVSFFGLTMCSALHGMHKFSSAPILKPNQVARIPVEVRTGLREAVETNDIAAVTRMIRDEGVNPNTPDETQAQRLPLHHASSIEMVRLLLVLGAQINAQDRNGQTALHWAATRFENELVCELLERGADKAILDDNGHSAFCFTTEFCPIEVRLKLLAHHMSQDNPKTELPSVCQALKAISPRFRILNLNDPPGFD